MSKAILIFSLMLFCSSLVFKVQGQNEYEVHVTIYSFENSDSRCVDCRSGSSSSLTCCDSNSTGVCNGSELCDLYLSFCLSNTPTNSNFPCPPESRVDTTTILFNTRNVTINQSEDTILGLRKPLIGARGISWSGAQLDIRIFDRDFRGDPDDLVDVFLINVTTNIGNSTERTRYNGIFGLANIDLSFEVMCLDDCSTTCDSGYTGANCETKIVSDPCLELGLNYCNGMGVCVNGTCFCSSGFTGAQCEYEINECTDMNITCNNNGQCVDGLNSISCVCNSGYTGEECEVDLTLCLGEDGIQCSGNGRCVEDPVANRFVCVCEVTYTGELCQTPIMDCLDVNCGTDSTEATTSAQISIVAIATGSALALIVLLLLIISLTIAVAILFKKRNELTAFEVAENKRQHNQCKDAEGSLIINATPSILSNTSTEHVNDMGVALQATNPSDVRETDETQKEDGPSDQQYAQIGPVYATLETEEDREERYKEAVELNTKHKYDSVDGVFKYEYVDTVQQTVQLL